MMKTIVSIAAVSLAAIATPALAGTLSAEVRFADVRAGKANDSTEYKIDYAGKVNSVINYGAELTVKQDNDEGPLGSKLAVRAGPRLPTVLGFKSEAYGEIGGNFKQNQNFAFWGAGVKTSRALVGPVSIIAGYRHREAFEQTNRMTENRLDAGLSVALGSGNAVGAKYYRTTGTTRSDAVGILFAHTF